MREEQEKLKAEVARLQKLEAERRTQSPLADDKKKKSIEERHKVKAQNTVRQRVVNELLSTEKSYCNSLYIVDVRTSCNSTKFIY